MCYALECWSAHHDWTGQHRPHPAARSRWCHIKVSGVGNLLHEYHCLADLADIRTAANKCQSSQHRLQSFRQSEGFRSACTELHWAAERSLAASSPAAMYSIRPSPTLQLLQTVNTFLIVARTATRALVEHDRRQHPGFWHWLKGRATTLQIECRIAAMQTLAWIASARAWLGAS